MTTKRARSRRLVRSDEYSSDTACIARSGEAVTFIYGPYRNFGAPAWLACLWSLTAKGFHKRERCRIRARTRLALHDAILRAGWPSPWREVAR